MANLMTFDAHVRGIFENDETKFVAFNKLMTDASVGKYEEGITAEDANAKIRRVFREAIGVSESATKLEIRKAMKKRANLQTLFDLIEVVSLLHEQVSVQLSDLKYQMLLVNQ